VRLSAFFTVVFLVVPGVLATEKFEIAKSANLVVVGQLGKAWVFPWFDGWHIVGSIRVDQVLFGLASPQQELGYRFVCSCCSIWPKPDLQVLIGHKALWFLDRRNGDRWSPAGSCSDGGYRDLTDLAAYRSYLLLRKH
jgi:hypothetical protein